MTNQRKKSKGETNKEKKAKEKELWRPPFNDLNSASTMTLNALKQSLYAFAESYSPRDVQRFIDIISEHDLGWFEYDGTIWVPVREVCTAKGQCPTIYTINWKGKERSKFLRGRERLAKGDLLKNMVEALRTRHPRYKNKRRYRQQFYLEWIKVVDYYYYEQDSSKLSEEEIVKLTDGLAIDSRFVSSKLKITHRYLTDLIKRYDKEFSKLGNIIKRKDKSKGPVGEDFYILSEDQCYLMLSLLGNKKEILTFKVWFINHLRTIKNHEKTLDGEGEQRFQSQLVKLSSYCSLKVRSELVIQDSFSRSKNKTRRIDLLIENSIAVELKNEIINNKIISDIVGTRGYLNLLQNHYPTLKTLILVSPKGITEDAKRLIEAMKPKVIYMRLDQLALMIANAILRETPESGHWWLYNFVFPQYKEILPKQLLKDVLYVN